MRALRAVEEVLVLALLALGGRGVGVWVRHLGRAAVLPDRNGLVPCYHGREGGSGEDVSRVQGKGVLACGDGFYFWGGKGWEGG